MYPVHHNPDYLNSKEFKYRYDPQKGEGFSGAKDLADLIDCSYHPSLYTCFPTIANAKVAESELPGLDTAHKAKIKYPCQCCYTSLLYCKDKSGLFFLGRHAQQLLILTTDLNSQNHAFMQACLPELKTLSVTHSHQKVKGILVLGFAKTPKIVDKDQVATDRLTQYGKVLIFQPTESRAAALYQTFPSDYPVARHIKDSVKLHGKFIDAPYHTVLAHSLGNLGKAINLPRFHTVVVDSRIYKPAIAMDLTAATPESIAAIIQTARFEQGKQNAGRIIREQPGQVGTSLKVVIFTNINAEDFQRQVAMCSYEMMCDRLAAFHFAEDLTALIHTAHNYLANGKAEKVPETTRLAKATSKDLSALAPKQREEIREAYCQTKLEEKIAGLKQQVVEMAQDGLKWRCISRKLHLDRLVSKRVRAYLRRIFTQHLIN